ncbi:MAG TPA: inosine/xanthosine triphosphatase [Gemmatimonadaceae bacterium]|nr:inosine/xanthosine triphosphatase [Gemmatimonadaceae bacterium]
MTLQLSAVRLVAVGSTNPVKIAAVRAVIAPLAPGAEVRGIGVASSVPNQPWGDEETIRGARTRAASARERLDADLGFGIEGGVVDAPEGVRTCAWAAVVDRHGTAATGGSLAMPLPPSVAAALRAGTELGHAMDALTGQRDTKHAQGAVGILTAGLVDRQRAYEVLVAYAMARFIAPEWWERDCAATA